MIEERTIDCTRYFSHEVNEASFYGGISRFGLFTNIRFRFEGARDEDAVQLLQEVAASAAEHGAEHVSFRFMDDREVYLAQTAFGELITIGNEANKAIGVQATAYLDVGAEALRPTVEVGSA
jgi:hypothetical protein